MEKRNLNAFVHSNLRFSRSVFIFLTCVLLVLASTLLWRLEHTPTRASTGWFHCAVPSDVKSRSVDFPCLDRHAALHNRTEDIFCLKLPPFDQDLKNPCFYDYDKRGKPELRCLPYFMIIGVDKSGSSDLHSRIIEHPQISNNSGYLAKETNYWPGWRYGFNDQATGPMVNFNEYPDYFKNTAERIEETGDKFLIAGDATPMDFWDHRHWPLIPQNKYNKVKEPVVLTPHLVKYIHGDRPPKLIIQFREPVERLFSDYIFMEQGETPQQFHTHVLEAIAKMDECIVKHSRRWCFYDEQMYHDLPVRLHISCYSVYLQDWLNVFPLSAFHIIRTTDYAQDMKKVLTSLFTFLQAEPLSDSDMQLIIEKKRNRVTEKKIGKYILPDTFEILRKYYDQYNKETAELLQDDGFLWRDHY